MAVQLQKIIELTTKGLKPAADALQATKKGFSDAYENILKGFQDGGKTNVNPENIYEAWRHQNPVHHEPENATQTAPSTSPKEPSYPNAVAAALLEQPTEQKAAENNPPALIGDALGGWGNVFENHPRNESHEGNHDGDVTAPSS